MTIGPMVETYSSCNGRVSGLSKTTENSRYLAWHCSATLPGAPSCPEHWKAVVVQPAILALIIILADHSY